jgi:hypothetical protein
MEGYTTFEFEVLCREVLKLNLKLKGRGELITLARVAGDVVPGGSAGGDQGFATVFATVEAQTQRSPGNLSASGASFLRGVGDLNLPQATSNEVGRGGSSDGFREKSGTSATAPSEGRRSRLVDRPQTVANVANALADALKSVVSGDLVGARPPLLLALRAIDDASEGEPE